MMKRVIVCVVLSAFFMTGCGEGDQAASSSQPQVEYASPETASVEIQNYMNADWLYDEYFGEYVSRMSSRLVLSMKSN